MQDRYAVVFGETSGVLVERDANLILRVQCLFTSLCAQCICFAHGSWEFRPFTSNLIYPEPNNRLLPKGLGNGKRPQFVDHYDPFPIPLSLHVNCEINGMKGGMEHRLDRARLSSRCWGVKEKCNASLYEHLGHCLQGPYCAA